VLRYRGTNTNFTDNASNEIEGPIARNKDGVVQENLVLPSTASIHEDNLFMMNTTGNTFNQKSPMITPFAKYT